VKDRWVVTALIYYATPWLLRGIAGAFAAVVMGWRRRWWFLKSLPGLAVAGIAAMQAWDSVKLSTPITGATTLTVATWNTGHVFHSDRALWPAAGESDVCAIVETGHFSEQEWSDFIASRPGESWLRLDAGTALGVKGEILDSVPIHGADDPFRAFRNTVRLPGKKDFCVVVIDIHSQPWIDRQPILAAIRQATIDAGADRHCIFLGDFNTPCESRWLEEWKAAGLTLANDGPGQGIRETWPYGIPLLTLDQIWINSAWECEGVWHERFGSDHAKVIAALEEGGDARQ